MDDLRTLQLRFADERRLEADDGKFCADDILNVNIRRARPGDGIGQIVECTLQFLFIWGGNDVFVHRFAGPAAQCFLVQACAAHQADAVDLHIVVAQRGGYRRRVRPDSRLAVGENDQHFFAHGSAEQCSRLSERIGVVGITLRLQRVYRLLQHFHILGERHVYACRARKAYDADTVAVG